MRALKFSDEVITIRTFERNDKENFFVAAKESMMQLYPYLAWCHPEYALDDAKDWISLAMKNWRNDIEYHFVVESVINQEILGGVSITHVNQDNKFANMGYWVRTSHLKQGIATRATRLAAKFAFDYLSLNRVEIVVEVRNKASQRVAEKIGGVKEGLCRNRLFARGEPQDAIMYSIIPSGLSDKI